VVKCEEEKRNLENDQSAVNRILSQASLTPQSGIVAIKHCSEISRACSFVLLVPWYPGCGEHRRLAYPYMLATYRPCSSFPLILWCKIFIVNSTEVNLSIPQSLGCQGVSSRSRCVKAQSRVAVAVPKMELSDEVISDLDPDDVALITEIDTSSPYLLSHSERLDQIIVGIIVVLVSRRE
jgi:hypothetical protein